MTADFHALVFLFGVIVILLTPGPTNTLLAAAGLAQGLWSAVPLVAFELVGYLLAISMWGVFLTSIEQYYPWVGTTVRVACSGYLIYLAVQIWRATSETPRSTSRTIGPMAVFITTVLNPKGLLFASTIFPAHAFDDGQVYVAAMALFTCVVVPIGTLWVAMGVVVGSGRVIAIDPVKLQRVFALVIGVFSATIAWTTVR